MTFVFNSKKVAQAVAYLLSLEPNRRTEYLRILKLLYMADRNALKEMRRPITSDQAWSMKLGPVLEDTYDIIKNIDQYPEWSRAIRKEGYFLELRGAEPVETGSLSKYERRKLREASEQCLGKDWKQVSDLTHDFPEWTDPGRGREFIPLRKVLKAIGLLDEATQIEEERDEAVLMDHFLSDGES